MYTDARYLFFSSLPLSSLVSAARNDAIHFSPRIDKRILDNWVAKHITRALLAGIAG